MITVEGERGGLVGGLGAAHVTVAAASWGWDREEDLEQDEGQGRRHAVLLLATVTDPGQRGQRKKTMDGEDDWWVPPVIKMESERALYT